MLMTTFIVDISVEQLSDFVCVVQHEIAHSKTGCSRVAKRIFFLEDLLTQDLLTRVKRS